MLICISKWVFGFLKLSLKQSQFLIIFLFVFNWLTNFYVDIIKNFSKMFIFQYLRSVNVAFVWLAVFICILIILCIYSVILAKSMLIVIFVRIWIYIYV